MNYELESILKALKDSNDVNVSLPKEMLESILEATIELERNATTMVKVEDMFSKENYDMESNGRWHISLAKLAATNNPPREVLVNSTELIALYKENKKLKSILLDNTNELNGLKKLTNTLRDLKIPNNKSSYEDLVKVNIYA